MALDTKKLIAAGYTQQSDGAWTLGTFTGDINSSGTMGIDLAGDQINTQKLSEFNQDINSQMDSLNVSFPIPQTGAEIRSFNFQEGVNVYEEGLAHQSQYLAEYESNTEALLNAQENYNNANKTDPSAFALAYQSLIQAKINQQNSYIKLLNAKIESYGGLLTYYSTDIFWPIDPAATEAAQEKVDELTVEWNQLKDEVAAHNTVLSSLNDDLAQTQSDITSIKNGNTPDRFKYSQSDSDAEGYLENAIDFFESVLGNLGEKAAKQAMYLANVSVGDTIKNYDEAIASWNKYGLNVVSKLSNADLQAVKNALGSLTQDQVAAQFKKWEGYFGKTGKILQVSDFYDKVSTAIDSGDWGPVLNYISSYLAGMAVSDLTAFFFGSLVIDPPTAVIFAVLGIVLATYVDEDHMKAFADWFDAYLAGDK